MECNPGPRDIEIHSTLIVMINAQLPALKFKPPPIITPFVLGFHFYH